MHCPNGYGIRTGRVVLTAPKLKLYHIWLHQVVNPVPGFHHGHHKPLVLVLACTPHGLRQLQHKCVTQTAKKKQYQIKACT